MKTLKKLSAILLFITVTLSRRRAPFNVLPVGALGPRDRFLRSRRLAPRLPASGVNRIRQKSLATSRVDQ